MNKLSDKSRIRDPSTSETPVPETIESSDKGVARDRLIGNNNSNNQFKLIGILLLFMLIDLAASQYVNIIYGVPIIAMQAIIVRILADRWGLSEYVNVEDWLPKSGGKK